MSTETLPKDEQLTDENDGFGPPPGAEAPITDDTPIQVDVVPDPVDTTPSGKPRRPLKEPPADVTDDELAQYSEKVRKRIQHFSKGYHEERAAKEKALQDREEVLKFASSLVEKNKQLEANVNKSQSTALGQAKRAAEVEYTAAQRLYREAYEGGKTDEMLAAQEALTSAKIKLDKIANFKLPPLQQKQTPVQRQPQPSQVQVPEDVKAQDWAKENKWFGADEEMTAFAYGLHAKLVKQGVDPKSDRYYEAIDTRMRQVFPDQFGDGDDDQEPTPQARGVASKTVVASASRSVAPRKVQLTQREVNLARRMGVPIEEYAKEQLKLRSNGNG